MGIRFACHICGKKLNIKRELAGRRGVCPSCSAKIRIPLDDAETSTPVELKAAAVGSVSSRGGGSTVATLASVSSAVDLAASQPQADSSNIEADSGVSGQADISGGSGVAFDSASGLLDDDPAAVWYVRPPSGGQYGPASGAILKQWISEGRVADTALLWRDGWPQWRDAGEVLAEISDSLPSGNVPGPVAPPSKQQSESSGSVGLGPERLESGSLTGEAEVGMSRRSRSSRRILLIGVLSALVVALLGVLVVVGSQ